ncbi:MAG: DUF167 domain-containing protein [Planctomycetota bacterium]|nr:MAG: DUF167 domain-containing protein [Planctomycetota bacterium]
MRVKAVPGASRNAVAGLLGDRLKVRVAAPAEGGKANEAIAALLARRLGVGRRDVQLVEGPTQPRKTFRVEGLSPAEVAARLNIAGPRAPS